MNSQLDMAIKPSTTSSLPLPQEKTENIQAYARWSKEENLRYLEFLQEIFKPEANEDRRRPKYFFKKMQEFVGNHRSAENCRSHHQRLLKKCLNIEGILNYLKELYQDSQNKEVKKGENGTAEKEILKDVKIEETIEAEDEPVQINLPAPKEHLPFYVFNGQVYF